MKKNKVILIILIVIALSTMFITINIHDKENIKDIQNNETALVSQEEKNISMQKGDRFVLIGDIAIYINQFDESIYMFNTKEKSYKKLYHSEDGIDKIYFDGNDIYLLPSYYRGKGIIKIDLLGNAQKIYEGASIQLWLEDDKIYFTDQIGYDQINGTPQGNLCVMNKDGSNKQFIIENVKNYFQIVDNYIYYTEQDSRSIYKANIDGTNKTEIAKGRTYITSATNDYLTYIDYSDGEKHRIVFLDNMKNIEIGRFGNAYVSNGKTYFYTRKLIDSNNNIENEYTLFSIDLKNKSVIENWTNDENGLEHLSYIYNNYCYIRIGNEYYKININNKDDKEKMEFGTGTYFIDGKAYSVKSTEGNIKELLVYDLDDMSKDIINTKQD